ncbi:MAG: hypothetical protein KAQ88_05875 [Hyphomicrobiaceae bacterium]|nr:hypothetical protein [Hyphomicrobiaceae bacterium]
MRRFWAWQTAPEDYESQREAGRYNPALELQYCTDQNYIVTLGAGNADEIDVFTEGSLLYVLSTNQGLSYCGMQVFEAGEEVGETFIDSSADQCDYLLGLTPIWRAKRLADWMN